MRTGLSNRMRVSLLPTSMILRTSRSGALRFSAAATLAADGPRLDTYSFSRPSAGIDVAFTFGGNETSANEATSLTDSAGNFTVFIEALPASWPAGASAVTLIPGRAESPPPVALTSWTKPPGSTVTTGV